MKTFKQYLKESGNIILYRDIDNVKVVIEPDGSYTFWKNNGKTKGAQNRSLHGQDGAVKELMAIGYKPANSLNESATKITESWTPDSQTISWLKDYLKDVKNGEGWVNIDKVVYDADIELNKDFSKNKKELADYIKRIGGASILKEGTIYTVIRTKNGKVDYIEKVEQLSNGTYMKKAGTSFDRAFIGMDPQEAKNALVKYSHFDPKLIMIDEGCGKIEESDVPTSKRELYNKAKIGFNGLKKRLDDILSLVEKGEYNFVSSFLEDVATSCKRMAKAYDDAYRMDKAGKMYD